jgi:hypothetical protein
VCEESKQKSECLLTDDRRKLVRLDPMLQQAVTFKKKLGGMIPSLASPARVTMCSAPWCCKWEREP